MTELAHLLAPLNAVLFTSATTRSSWAELLGFVTGAACVWLTVPRRDQQLSGRHRELARSSWCCSSSARLCADSGLQVVYIVLGFVGWWQWLHGGRDRAAPRRRPGARRLLAGCAVFVVVATWGLTLLLRLRARRRAVLGRADHGAVAGRAVPAERQADRELGVLDRRRHHLRPAVRGEAARPDRDRLRAVPRRCALPGSRPGGGAALSGRTDAPSRRAAGGESGASRWHDHVRATVWSSASSTRRTSATSTSIRDAAAGATVTVVVMASRASRCR